MDWFDVRRPGQVGNCPGDFDGSEIAAGTEVKPLGGGAEQLPDVGRKRQAMFDVLGAQVTVVFGTTAVSVALSHGGDIDYVLGCMML